jgi:hypothetical protein
MKYLEFVPEDEINKITHLNALRLWQFDPFKHRPRENCTVGALRAEAAGWDVSIKSTGLIERDRKATGSAELASTSEKIIHG